MATTTNTGAKKIDQNEQWRNILGIHNDTVDAYDEHITSHSQAIGNLSNLTTTEKGSLVGAANELNSKFITQDYSVDMTATVNAYSAFVFTIPNGYKPVGGGFTQTDGVDDILFGSPIKRKLDGKCVVRLYVTAGASTVTVKGTYKCILEKD